MYKVIVVLFVCLQLGVVDSPPRVFNSPYSTATSMDYNPMSRMSEFKVCNLVEKNKFYILYRLFCFSSSLFLNSNYKCNVLNAGSAPATLTESVKLEDLKSIIALFPHTFTHVSLLRLTIGNDTQQDTDPPLCHLLISRFRVDCLLPPQR